MGAAAWRHSDRSRPVKALRRWFHARLMEMSLAYQLRSLESKPGWVVMAEDDDGDWHALSGGCEYGMDYDTGRFEDRGSARAFGEHRNIQGIGAEHYYATHESILHASLPATY